MTFDAFWRIHCHGSTVNYLVNRSGECMIASHQRHDFMKSFVGQWVKASLRVLNKNKLLHCSLMTANDGPRVVQPMPMYSTLNSWLQIHMQTCYYFKVIIVAVFTCWFYILVTSRDSYQRKI